VRLQKDVEYGLISLMALGEGDGLMSAAELAQRFSIPQSLLAKLLQRLQKAGLIAAERGAHGGYRLLRSLEGITVQEVVEAIRGVEPLAPCLEGDPCAQFDSCTIRHGVVTLQGLFQQLLNSLSLAQLGGLSRSGGLALEIGASDGLPSLSGGSAAGGGRVQTGARRSVRAAAHPGGRAAGQGERRGGAVAAEVNA
jgi:Rrf2 family protein